MEDSRLACPDRRGRLSSTGQVITHSLLDFAARRHQQENVVQRLDVACAGDEFCEQFVALECVAALFVSLAFVGDHLPYADAQRGEPAFLAEEIGETPCGVSDDEFMSEVLEVVDGNGEVVAREIVVIDSFRQPAFRAETIAFIDSSTQFIDVAALIGRE